MSASGGARFAGLTDSRRGILWMVLATLVFGCVDATAKYLSQSYPVPEVLWARHVFHALIVAAWLRGRLPGLMATERLGLHLARSLLLLAASIFYFFGLSLVSLAEASAVFYMAPILVTALSMPLLRERVGPRRWAGVAAGFLGALIIIRPGTEMMQAAIFLPLAAAAVDSFYQIITRLLSRTDRVLTMMVYTPMVGALATSLAVPFFWTTPDLAGWVLMASLGLLGAAGHFALIKAFQAAPAATVAPFNYTSLIWATVLGFVLFGNLPDGFTVLGAAVIAASGLYILRRESLRRRAVGGPA